MKDFVKSEVNRITKLLKNTGVEQDKVNILKPVIENVAWMKVKLEDTRKDIENSKIVIGYNNGGGQKGVRENPIFKGYENLWKAYMNGMTKILEAVPDDFKDLKTAELEKPRTTLDRIRAKKNEG